MDYFPFDDDYVRRLREGDPATEEHYSSYFPPKLQIVLRLIGTPAQDADDIIQDTLMRVLIKVRADEIRDGHTFGKYVVTTCRNIAKEDFRKKRKTDQLSERYDKANRDNPETDAIKHQLNLLILMLVSSLGERDAAVVRELFRDELDKDEICRRHKIDRKYLRVIVHRAIRRLRELLGLT
jgi:RNA polymerase sigma-70 factor, ECF subfamily